MKIKMIPGEYNAELVEKVKNIKLLPDHEEELEALEAAYGKMFSWTHCITLAKRETNGLPIRRHTSSSSLWMKSSPISSNASLPPDCYHSTNRKVM